MLDRKSRATEKDRIDNTYSVMNEARAHPASTASHALRGIPHALCPEVRAIATGMNAIKDKPLTAPTMQESTVT